MHVDLRPANEAIKQGKLREAYEICQQAISVDPANADAIGLLGIVAGRMGNHEMAARLMGDALTIRPSDNHFRRNYVTALVSLDRLPEARRCVDEGLAREPEHAGLLSLMGVVAGRDGDLDTAIEALEKAAKLQPNVPQIQYNLGELHRRRSDHQSAKAAWERCLALDPKHTDALNNLAGLCLADGDFLESLGHIQELLKLSPRSAQAFGNLSVAMHAAGDVRQAIVCLRNALTINRSQKDFRFRLVNLLISSAEFEEAEKELSDWRAMETSDARLLAITARMLERQGKLDEARQVFDSIADADRDSTPVMMTDAILCDAEGDKAGAVERLDQVVENNPDAMDQIGIRFLMAKCKDSLGQYEEAFEHASVGNELRRKGFGTPFQPESSVQVRDLTIDAYREAWKSHDPAAGCPSDRPVFIVGMPRSGTSITEQILGSHPDVFAAGELQLLSALVRETGRQSEPEDSTSVFRIVDHQKDGSKVPMIPADFSAETLREIGQQYVNQIEAMSSGEARITDKMPYNFLFVPLIKMALPNAKIIHTRRHPLDTCLSCFFQNFTGGSEFSFDLEDLAVYYKNYVHTMSAWRDDLGVEMLEVDYESLVSDPEPVVRQMLDYIGMPWDPNCLKSHESKRVVATASYQQVREPIYTKSVHRWKNYEKQLQPLRDELADLLGEPIG
ncbi:tetratricopeptide repeat-containing sulfotransferase family protein [Crateriforma conspicua]|uniref:tetratricopeptide repeat-containing sulfotransferase family protein n=1 Tax=Crateriforma conspicua TaxID=2527996 RepID=UPI00118824EE|nr:tetratricopeptide repeat-containing sulfotransferase family protein [Crateriforma conspicua]QDV66156.1 invasion protein regulator [Crateriforma conspicua]